MKRQVKASAAALVALSMVTAACGGGSDSSDGASDGGTSAATTAAKDEGSATTEAMEEGSDTTEAMEEGSDTTEAMEEGAETTEAAPETTAAPTVSTDENTITIWSSVDQPVQDGLNEVLNEKLADSGITVDWQKVGNVGDVTIQRVQAGDTPDIVMVPQPGVMKTIVDLDGAVPLDDVLDVDRLASEMTPGTLEAGQYNDGQYGLMANMNVKSLVFYNKEAWDAAGYAAPQSLDELNALTEQIKSDGGVPWCMGIQSDGGSTGWPATDWFEDLIMRYGGVDVYNEWVNHDIDFNSDVVKQAAAEFETLMFTDGNVLGGREAIASTSFWGIASSLFGENGPDCWLIKQGSFIVGAFPDDVQADADNKVGVFAFPPAEAGGDNPVLGGGDIALLLNDTENGRTVMQALAESDIGSKAVETGVYLSPFKTTPIDSYPTKLTQEFANVAYSSSAFLFDGSDQMPAEVGNTAFWNNATEWIAGTEDLDTMLNNIDDAWP